MTGEPLFWIGMASGKRLDFENPRPDAVDINDLAHHLSRENRWQNNLEPISYSVAQHALVKLSACEHAGSRVYALLDDAAKAYIGEFTPGLKLWLAAQGADVMALKRRIMNEAVYPAFNLPQPTLDIARDVHRAEQRALATEARDVIKGRPLGWAPSAPPLSAKIKFITQPKIEDAYRSALLLELRDFRDRSARGL